LVWRKGAGHAGDRIIAIDGRAVTGASVAEVAQRLRGAPGSTVTVMVQRDGSEKPLTVAVKRAANETGAGPR
jgi:carboxyl-terminal processing protease